MDQISPNAMKSVIDIDVLGSYNTVKATLHYSGTPLQSHVSVAKAGVDAMAMSVAIEQGPKGITSNIIAPGPIADTEGVARLSKSDHRDKSSKGIPSGRYGTVKEIADATVYLFSDAGNYVNGETLVGKMVASRLTRNHVLTDTRSRWRSMAYSWVCERLRIPRLPPVWRGCKRRFWRQEVEIVDARRTLDANNPPAVVHFRVMLRDAFHVYSGLVISGCRS